MGIITDKELLTFCNLTNLKMEYANLIEKYESKEIIDEKTKKKITVQTPVNHTIYSLLEKNKN